MKKLYSELHQHLSVFQQQHLLRWWDELADAQQLTLAADIRAIDFSTIDRVWKESRRRSRPSPTSPSGPRADSATAPRSVVYQPASISDHDQRLADAEIGERLLAEGRVAVITVAGGQGSRLGFDLPKGMFPIGPISDRSLFQVFAEQILARRIRHGGSIPWLVMTSAATHTTTIEFFTEKKFFGLDPQTVFFFKQGSMPAVDALSGKILMSDKATPCLSPDGHGGLVTAIKSSGVLESMAATNVEHFFYHQVDNPTVIICDPPLIGVHLRHKSSMTTNVVRKRQPTERMGVLVNIDDRTEIIEYTELNEEQASRKDAGGKWIFWAGNTAVHVFSRQFFEQLMADGCQLELHVALKLVPYMNNSGETVAPIEPNANKFERFIFDALPLAQNALIVEGNRDREFNPVKNASGDDSPETSRSALSRIGREWLASAGHPVDESVSVEISPLVALDAAELATKLASGATSVQALTSP